MQGKLFQRCAHLFYCSVLSLGGNVNTRRMSKPDMGSIFHINNQWNILVIGNYYVNYQNYQNSMLLTSSDTKRTLMHLFLFTNSAQRELVSIYTQSIRNCNLLSLHYILGITCTKDQTSETTLRNYLIYTFYLERQYLVSNRAVCDTGCLRKHDSWQF